MKKILFLFLFFFLSLTSFASAASYSFAHVPANSFDVSSVKKKGALTYLKYDGKTKFEPINVSLDAVDKFVKSKGYFKFFKYGFYFREIFDDLSDSSIDLDYLGGEILDYPVAVVYVGDHLYIYVHYNNLKSDDIAKIEDFYQSKNFEIEKSGIWYVIRYEIDPGDLKSYWPYEYKKYFKSLKRIAEGLPTVNLQMGHNPLDRYRLDDFSTDILQFATVVKGKLKGVLVGLNLRTYQPEINYHSQTYYKDKQMNENLMDLYDAVGDYFKNNGRVPNDILTLFPNYLSYYVFNPYNHKLMYEAKDNFCFTAGFDPLSIEYTTKYKSSLNSNGYMYINYCVK